MAERNDWDLAKMVKDLRDKLGLTQEQFAARVDVTFSTVNRWENDRGTPSPLAVRRIEECTAILFRFGLRPLYRKGKRLMGTKSWIGLSLVVLVLGIIMVLRLQSPGQEKEPIKLGVCLSLTGEIAPYGQSARRGIELAVCEINDAGGIGGHPLTIIMEDCQSNPRLATMAVQKLIFQDKVPAAVGFIGSSLLLASAPLFNNNHVVLISPGASSPAIREAGDYIFRTRASGQLEATTLAEYAVEDLNCRRIGVLYVNNDYGLSWLASFTERATLLGSEIVAEAAFQQGATDLRSQISKIKASKPACLLILGYLDEIALGLRQCKELGLEVPILTTIGIQDAKIFDLAGTSAQGVAFSAVDYDPSANQASRQFYQAYSSRFGQSPDIFAANAYDSVYLLAEAIEKCGTNGEKLQQYLSAVKDYRGAGGTLSFDEKGDIVKPVQMKKVEGKRFIVINQSRKKGGSNLENSTR